MIRATGTILALPSQHEEHSLKLPPIGDAVAFLHTHNDWYGPRPSKQDVAVARKLHISVYVLSKSGLLKITPDGNIVQLEKGTAFLR